jgi:hypothetical protein
MSENDFYSKFVNLGEFHFKYTMDGEEWEHFVNNAANSLYLPRHR